jgi:hypothetical protein
MSDGDVHTVNHAGRWFNEIEGAPPSKHSAVQQAEAENVGRELAMSRGVAHVIHAIDGTVCERHLYE